MIRVTFLSDFGTADGYAAAMAGVVADRAPNAAIEHASHDVEPGDIRAAAIALRRYATLYPEGTVHVVVVDPGVGTDRRAVAVRIDRRLYVAPDNGVLSLVLDGAEQVEAVQITDAVIGSPTSATFHGRDVFAPAAGFLAAGGSLDELGPAASELRTFALPEPARDAQRASGEVVEVDRFGNLITNIPAEWLEAAASVEIEGRDVGPVRGTYGDVTPGEVLALVGSLDLLEVSVRDGSAAARLEVGRGASVTVRS